MTRRRWSTLSADEANLLARTVALDNLLRGRISRDDYDRHVAMLAAGSCRHTWIDSGLGLIVGGLLLAALLAAWWW